MPMNDVNLKQKIEVVLKGFADQPLFDAAIALFETLGYTSEKRLKLSPNNNHFSLKVRK